MKIDGRTFAVTGAASGLALATAKLLHQKGAYVALLDRNCDAGADVVQELGRDRARFFECDVMDTDSIAAAVKGTAEWVKETGKPLRGVLAGAGVAIPAKIIDPKGNPVDMETVDIVLGVNLRGTIDTIRQFLPQIIASEGEGPDKERGVITLVASSAAYDGQPGQMSYSASKGAITSMVLPLARDLARYGVRVVAVAPSLFGSGMTRLMSDKVRKSLERGMEFPLREGKAEEFAALCAHVVENVMLNGTTIRLDGAMRMPSKM